MAWTSDGVTLEDCEVFGAPYGGPLAVIKDKDIIRKSSQRSEDLKWTVFIYTSAGRKLSEIEITNRKFAGIGWNTLEQLVLVCNDGQVVIYDVHGKIVRNFLLLDVITAVQIVECHFWGDGVVALTSDMQLHVAEGFGYGEDTSKIRVYSLRSPNRAVTAMTIIPSRYSRSGLLEVIVATEDRTIIVIDENDFSDQQLQEKLPCPITKMSVAASGLYVACFRQDGVLSVMSTSFTSNLLDFDTKSMSRPLDIKWCGDDAILLTWKNTGVVMVGPFGDWMNFAYNGAVHIVPETDCCRIITATTCEVLQRVHSTTEAIRRIGSTDPAALLFDAMEGYEEGDPRSDENIRSIANVNQLDDAVRSCVEAASYEFDIERQQSLFKAASYGKSFCKNFDPTLFVETSKVLRVLNDLRRPEVGCPLTINQYRSMSSELLLRRLIIHNHHLLALKICDLMGLSNERVLTHWASEKVKRMSVANASDEEIFNCIKSKLQGYDNVAFLEIASTAYHMGKQRLATMILDLEHRAAVKIPLLLTMREDDLALQKALQSEDTNLVYFVVTHLNRTKSGTESFYKLLFSHQEAANLLINYYRHRNTDEDRAILDNLLLFSKNYLDAGISSIRKYCATSEDAKQRMFVSEAIQIFSKSKETQFYKNMCEEHLELLQLQIGYSLRSGLEFSGLSVSDTLLKIFNLATVNNSENDAQKWNAEAVKLVKKFKLAEKMVWNIRILSYSEAKKWDHLYKLACEKKSPVGYRPFVQACVKHGLGKQEMEKYIEKMSSMEEKCDMYVELQWWSKALEVAGRLKDVSRIQEIQQLSNKVTISSIDCDDEL